MRTTLGGEGVKKEGVSVGPVWDELNETTTTRAQTTDRSPRDPPHPAQAQPAHPDQQQREHQTSKTPGRESAGEMEGAKGGRGRSLLRFTFRIGTLPANQYKLGKPANSKFARPIPRPKATSQPSPGPARQTTTFPVSSPNMSASGSGSDSDSSSKIDEPQARAAPAKKASSKKSKAAPEPVEKGKGKSKETISSDEDESDDDDDMEGGQQENVIRVSKEKSVHSCPQLSSILRTKLTSHPSSHLALSPPCALPHPPLPADTSPRPTWSL